MDTIFVQIASYRDSQLLFTLRDLFEKAKNPENLFVSVCWQKDENDTLFEYENNPQVKLIPVPYKESKGACWARNKLQQNYNNEKYTLQLDSHHRFIQDWDTTIIDMYNKLKEKGIEKPLLTSYLPSFNPEKDPEERVMCPWKISFKEKTHDKQVLFIPSYIDNHKTLEGPIPANFYSAHFTFTTGEFVLEVPHDPELYFTGEEMSITVRAYTYGYTLFHPHILIAWHEYTRKYRSKHWDDDKEWWKKDQSSKNHYLSIFNNYGKYGIGTKKTIQDYIDYSGIDFLNFDEIKEKKDEKKNKELQVKKMPIKKEQKIEEIQIKEKDDDEEEEEEDNKYRKFEQSWRDWIKGNVQGKVPVKEIRKILKSANFDPKFINYEIDFYVRELN